MIVPISDSRQFAETLVHIQRRLGLQRASDLACRDARHGHVRRDIAQHQASGAHFRAITNPYRPENFGTCTEQDAGTDFRVTITAYTT